MMVGALQTHASPWEEVARAKLTKVLGPEKAEAMMKETLAKLGLSELRTPDDLHRFGKAMSETSGFAATVGALLSLHAVMRGATTRTG